MPPAGDFIRIQIELGTTELKSYSIQWSNNAYRISTVIPTPHRTSIQEVVRGSDLNEGVQLFSRRILDYITTRSSEIQAEIDAALALEDNPRPGFRPGFFRRQAQQHLRKYIAWKANVSAQVEAAYRDATDRGWPLEPLRMPWCVA